jgi:tetratricopeptide (TPR) repeat protein
MRTHLIRAAMALAVILAVSSTAAAQSMLRGNVVDEQGQPIEGATVTIVALEGQANSELTTNARGEFQQIGLASGPYTITATYEDRTQQLTDSVSQARPLEIDFVLVPVVGVSAEVSEELAALANGAIALIAEGRNAEAVQMFNEVLLTLPNCGDCYYNLGVAYANQEQYDDAEQAFRRTIGLAPDHAEAYTGLAGLYNAQQRYDLAAEAGARAAELGSAGGGAGDPQAIYNQGVILWNAGNFADAKTHFEAAVAADPTIAMAHYQLGMANLNLGMVPEARSAFEGYLQAAPDGEKAAEVNGFLQQLPQ